MESLKELQELGFDLTVLYVEDDTNIANTMINYLSKFFKEVISAPDGEAGLALYKSNPCDLVITDIKMPKMNGLDMAREIKQLNNNQNIIIISAYSEMENFLTSIRLGIDGYIIKPVNYEDMNNLLHKIAKKIKAFKNNDTYLKNIDELLESLHSKNIELNHYTNALDKVAIVSKTDLKGDITFVNDFFCEISGYSREELIGKNQNIIRHPDVPKELFKELWKTIQNGQQWEGNIKNRAKNGEPYYVHATIIPLFENDNATIKEYMGIRFLTTDHELEKREFKRQVMGNYQVFRKENYSYKQRIRELENEIALLQDEDSFLKNHSNEDKQKHYQLNTQISHYEDEIRQLKEHHDKVLAINNVNVQKIAESYKQALKIIQMNKESIKNLEEDKHLKNKEIAKLEEKLTEQRHAIIDLQDTIKNIRKNKKEEKEETGFLKKLL
ncbi:MAG: response regulator [Candidatus Marinarcus sp.]|uniref:response regulator n=1 Tax=Candidatus Marinarcus sp. TaxID=3100987 RepID=UPI003AFF65CB